MTKPITGKTYYFVNCFLMLRPIKGKIHKVGSLVPWLPPDDLFMYSLSWGSWGIVQRATGLGITAGRTKKEALMAAQKLLERIGEEKYHESVVRMVEEHRFGGLEPGFND